ncbi:MAG: 2-succinyl-5-enolpyruvyl-6-hydroxy-3-cyclohexene-1-carboxylic-acid synthase [Polyangiaceae bacterium]|nr:2-succinyl-5-enolpyruvyl-6-hydroxy-3-cyclohexene-1-carboxylic-acid synthase [Polyangiaceae bacterium]
MSAPSLPTQWARLLIHSLADAGVSHAVVSPGSRSTPFAWAVLNCPRIESRIVVDERSAGYFAVAQGKMSGRATLLVCTSGSAAANYYPSVIEASESQTPLLVLTADRPLDLQARGAAQTIDQVKLYGDHVRRYVELALPDPDLSSLRALRSTTFSAELLTRVPRPGPVHLNARARKPLAPQPVASADDYELASSVDGILAQPLEACRSPTGLPDAASLARLVDACCGARAGIILCGPEAAASSLEPARVAALARATGFAVLPEATSQLRFCGDDSLRDVSCDAIDPLLRDGPAPPEPYVIVQLGRPPTASSYEAHLARHAHAALYVLARTGWPDPTNRARMVINGDPGTMVDLVAQELRRRASLEVNALLSERQAYRTRLRTADARAWRAVDVVLDAGAAMLSEGRVVRTVVGNVPAGSVLAVGNSLPVRELDMYCPGRLATARMLSQRGTNGIDGLVSGAAGAADVTRGAVTLILGDVSLLHDLGGLWAARSLGVPLVIVVINNGGGRIFDTIAAAETPACAQPEIEAWTTPPRLDLRGAAQLFGVRYCAARNPRELEAALQGVYSTPGLCLVEAVVQPNSVADEHRRYRAELDRALSRPDAAPQPAS